MFCAILIAEALKIKVFIYKAWGVEDIRESNPEIMTALLIHQTWVHNIASFQVHYCVFYLIGG